LLRLSGNQSHEVATVNSRGRKPRVLKLAV
jgi:hypothetical protein